MSLKLYNSLTRQKETFKPINPDTEVLLYTCGPTVYHFVHIGNFRTFVFEDILRRTLKFLNFKIKHAMNITDIDDKTIRGATKGAVSLKEFTTKYKDAFFADLKELNIDPAEFYPAATEYVEQMIEMIDNLLKKEIAYKGQDGSIYFAISKFKNYGKLSHFKLNELKLGASKRVAADEYDKEDASDFVLWKSYDPKRDGDIFWQSPFGAGRPGWHLECSCMAMKILGETIDIHVGGIDNMFPHHENEIAQSEAISGKPFANVWMHAEHLVVDGKKMSKSLGNFYTLRDLIDKGFTGQEIRYLLMQVHYKTQLNFTFEGLHAARSSLERLQAFVMRLQEIDQKDGDIAKTEVIIHNFLEDFKAALCDDLNMSVALAALFSFIREINTLCDLNQCGQKSAKKVLAALEKINSVLAVIDFQTKDEIPARIKLLFDQRLQARADKNFALADSLRSDIEAAGYLIEDGATGARLKLKRS